MGTIIRLAMSDKELLERLKADFLEKNAALGKAVKQLTIENRKSLEYRSRICALRNQALASYNLLSNSFLALPNLNWDTTKSYNAR